MVKISAALVKQLREKTGAGMMNCKKALTETEGDLDAAVVWLRKKGLASAAKKADRAASEGLVAVATDGTRGAIVELNSETDFVARNDLFQAFTRWLAGAALTSGGDVADLRKAVYPESSRSVEDEIAHLIATIGENMNLRRAATISVGRGVVASYVHAAVSPGLGRIGVLVGLESEGDAEALAAFGKKLAMHVAAANPEAIAVEDLDPDLEARERAVLTEQARATGKPDKVIQMMIEGRLRKFFQEVVLGEQTYVIDRESKVSAVIEAQAREIGAEIRVSGFQRVVLGEGLQKKDGDFAAEVAAQIGG